MQEGYPHSGLSPVSALCRHSLDVRAGKDTVDAFDPIRAAPGGDAISGLADDAAVGCDQLDTIGADATDVPVRPEGGRHSGSRPDREAESCVGNELSLDQRIVAR